MMLQEYRVYWPAQFDEPHRLLLRAIVTENAPVAQLLAGTWSATWPAGQALSLIETLRSHNWHVVETPERDLVLPPHSMQTEHAAELDGETP